MDCSPPGSSTYGVLQARILEWVTIPFSGEPSNLLFLPDPPHIQSVCRSSWLGLQNGSLLCPLLPTLPCSGLSPLPWMAALTAAANAPVSWPAPLTPTSDQQAQNRQTAGCYRPASLARSAPASLPFTLLLEQAHLVPTPGPLRLLFPLLEGSSHQTGLRLLLSVQVSPLSSLG